MVSDSTATQQVLVDTNGVQEQNVFEVSLESEDQGEEGPIKCSAVHTLERDIPDYDYSNLVKELRSKVLSFYESNPEAIARPDLEKVKNDDWFLSRFILRRKMNLDQAFDMIIKSLRYKNESFMNYMNYNDFPKEFYQTGALFPYEDDRKGNKVLYIRVKVHRKVPELATIFQTYIHFNFQGIDDAANGRGIVLVLDCRGAGLINADTDLLWYVFSLLFNYFPKGLSYVLVHGLPWILRPFWYLARGWIPDEYKDLIQFSNDKTIYEYIERKNLPDFLGGTCKRDYKAVPADCISLAQAAKLWGIERSIAERLLVKLSDILPEDTKLDDQPCDEEVDKLIEGQFLSRSITNHQ